MAGDPPSGAVIWTNVGRIVRSVSLVGLTIDDNVSVLKSWGPVGLKSGGRREPSDGDERAGTEPDFLRTRG